MRNAAVAWFLALGGLQTALYFPSTFPLERGLVWVYEISRFGGRTDVVQVRAYGAAEDRLLPPGSLWLSGFFPGPPRRVRGFLDGTIEEIGPDGEVHLWYKLGAGEGTSWTFSLAGPQKAECYGPQELSLKSRHENVEVPYGRFHNAILVRWSLPCRDFGIVREWFVPGVGLVQRVEMLSEGFVFWRLKEVRRTGGLIGGPPTHNRFSLPSSSLPTCIPTGRGVAGGQTQRRMNAKSKAGQQRLRRLSPCTMSELAAN